MIESARSGSTSASTASAATTPTARRTRSGARSARRRARPAPTASRSARSWRRPRCSGRTRAGSTAASTSSCMQALRAVLRVSETHAPTTSTRSSVGTSASFADDFVAAVVPGQPRHEPLPVGRRRRHAAAEARGAVPVHAARAADRLLRHRGRPVAGTRRPLRRRHPAIRRSRGCRCPGARSGDGDLLAFYRGPSAAAAGAPGLWRAPSDRRGRGRRRRPVRLAVRRRRDRGARGPQQRRRRAPAELDPAAGWTLALATDDGPRLDDGRLHLPPLTGAVLAGPPRRAADAATSKIVP